MGSKSTLRVFYTVEVELLGSRIKHAKILSGRLQESNHRARESFPRSFMICVVAYSSSYSLGSIIQTSKIKIRPCIKKSVARN